MASEITITTIIVIIDGREMLHSYFHGRILITNERRMIIEIRSRRTWKTFISKYSFVCCRWSVQLKVLFELCYVVFAMCVFAAIMWQRQHLLCLIWPLLLNSVIAPHNHIQLLLHLFSHEIAPRKKYPIDCQWNVKWSIKEWWDHK
jgi:hypothetical protein